MKKPATPKASLSRSRWLEAALELLHNKGIDAVTVDALASQLEITRGSFYHHFKNREDLSDEMLKYWNQVWTLDIREDIAALDLDGFQSLYALLKLIKHRRAAGYDSAVRAWAIHDDRAREVVAEVDKIRLDFIREQFRRIGFKGLDLENRCRLFLYYEVVDPAFFDPVDEEFKPDLDRVRIDFLTTP